MSSKNNNARELNITQRVENTAQARQLAQKKLNLANSKEITCNINLAGDLNYSAGMNVKISGFGIFDGNYSIESVTHNISRSGYTTSLNLHMGKTSKQAAKTKTKKPKRKAKPGSINKTIYADSSETYHG